MIAKIVLGVDPGTVQSAFVHLKGRDLLGKGLITNESMRDYIKHKYFEPNTKLYIEMIASMGMPVGQTVFETCVWIGRFIEAWDGEWEYVYRKDVKLFLCNSLRAKDSNIRQAIIDLYGGDKQIAIGNKKNPGPLYGIKKDIWAALGVAITAQQ